MVHLRTMTSLIALTDRALLSVSGPERFDFLNTLLSADVSEKPGDARFASLLTPQGKMIADVLAYTTADAVILEFPANSELPKRLRMYKLRANVELTPLDDWDVAVADEAVSGANPCFADPRDPSLGFRVYGPALGAESDASAYHLRRIKAVVPEGASDLEANKAVLLESGFERLKGVDFKKGCYVGQEVTARMKYRGLGKKRIMAIEADGDLRTGEAVLAGERNAGSVLTAVGKDALVLLRHEYVEGPLATDKGLAVRVTADPDAP